MNADLNQGIVRILKPDGSSGGATVGTGFVVTNEGLIATCAHVVEFAGIRPGGTVHLAFHASREEREATVEPEWWRDPKAGDVAILRLKGTLSEGVRPLPLGSSEHSSGHPFQSRGYRKAEIFREGLGAKGEIQDITTDSNGQPSLQLWTDQIDDGMSGAPLWDLKARRVVGMVSWFNETERHVDAWLAGATPTETLRKICPLLELSDVCPYRGLAAFTEEDAEFFFGRQRVVDSLLGRLGREPRFLALLGPSGSGKSSIVRAGLIPQLRRSAVPGSDQWGILVTRPADDPVAQLVGQGLAGAEEGLPQAVEAWLDRHREQTQLVLVIDQFEELLSICSEPARGKFIAQLTELLEAPLSITVVLVMRDDFYSHLGRTAPALLAWVERGGLANVSSTLEKAELVELVQEPAHAVGLEFEPGLVQRIVGDAIEAAPAPDGERSIGRSTVLPLLEFALTQLWKEGREGGQLTLEAYNKIQGVTGGLTRAADDAYVSISKELQPLARRVLTDLVHPGDESQGLPDSRRRVPCDELWRDESERDKVCRVVEILADARLLVTARNETSGQETVEIIHDVLLGWRRLQTWLNEDRRFLAWREKIDEQARAWRGDAASDRSSKRDPGKLLRGRDLVDAEYWWQQSEAVRNAGAGRRTGTIAFAQRFARIGNLLALRAVNPAPSRASTERSIVVLRPLEREFIQSSQRLHQWERTRSQMVVSLGLSLLVIVLLLILRSYTLNQVNFARQLVSYAGSTRDQQADGLPLSVLLAIEAARRFDPLRIPWLEYDAPRSPLLEAEQAVRRGLSLLPYPIAHFEHARPGPQQSPEVHDVAFSRSGRLLATAGQDGMVRIWSLAIDRTSKVLRGPALAIGRHQSDGVVTVAFSPDDRYLASGGADGKVHLWSLERVASLQASPTEPMELPEVNVPPEMQPTDGISDVAFCPTEVLPTDACYLAIASLDGKARLWKVTTRDGNVMAQTKAPLRASASKEGSAVQVAFSPKGDHLATASGDGIIGLWDVPSGSKRWLRRGHRGAVTAVCFDPQERLLATASADWTARLWRLSTGQPIGRPYPHSGTVEDIAFSPKPGYLATACSDGAAYLWRLDSPEGGQEEVHRMRHQRAVHMVAFNADGRYLVTAGEDGTARLWETDTGDEVWRMTHGAGVHRVAIRDDWPLDGAHSHEPHVSSDWLRVATASWDGSAGVWERPHGSEVARVPFLGDRNASAISPTGAYLASVADGDGNAFVWSTDAVRKVRPWPAGSRVRSVAYSQDGNDLATVGDQQVCVWEMAPRKRAWTTAVDRPQHAVVFSPDGAYLAIASEESPPAGNQAGSSVSLWDWRHDRKVPLDSDASGVTMLRFSRKGSYLAAAASADAADATVAVWKVASGRRLAWKIPHEGVHTIAFGPREEYLATASSDQACVWDLKRRQQVVCVSHQDGQVEDVAFSPDGRYLATAGDDKTARITEIAGGWKIAELPHPDAVWAVVFDPSGAYVATASKGGIARVWDVARRWEVARVTHPKVMGVAFAGGGGAGSDPGRYLVTLGGGSGRIWNWRAQDLIDAACAHLLRGLSDGEREQYLLGEQAHTCSDRP
jgi:WD40 repeat protein